MVKKIFIVLFVIWFGILLFMPKQELYYKLEQELAKEGIKINESQIEESLFSLTLKNADLYVKGIKIATVERVTLLTLLFYSKVELKELMLDDSLKHMAPQRIEDALLTYTLLSPVKLSIYAEGSFGTLKGDADLKERKVHLDFVEEKEIGVIKPMLKKGETGWYYETSF